MDYGVIPIIVILGFILLGVVGAVLTCRWDVEIKKDIKCAMEHKGFHEFIKIENNTYTDCYGDGARSFSSTLLWCPKCQRQISASWNDKSWVAIPLAKRGVEKE